MEVKNQVLLKAALVTIVLFAASLYIGYSIESQSYTSTESKLNEFHEELENALLFSLFIQTHNQTESTCAVLRDQLDASGQNALEISQELEDNKVTVFTDYNQLRGRYFLANMRFYLMLREYKQECGDQSLEPILFFYRTYGDCPTCYTQGRVLDTVRAECENARVFAFPADSEDLAMIRAFKTYYNITGTPSLVIRDATYNGVIETDRIKALIGC
ncbi:MAG: hypothetical protein PHS02_00690 [Candidatus ainarchaeum sp.]|nr:hypothetical protein [Candidatus ainarchaeum sp.]